MKQVTITVGNCSYTKERIQEEYQKYYEMVVNYNPVEILGDKYIATDIKVDCEPYGYSFEVKLKECVKFQTKSLDESNMRTQQKLMKYDPTTGEEKPYPSNAGQYRFYHGKVAWLFNPWNGEARCAQDIGSDCFVADEGHYWKSDATYVEQLQAKIRGLETMLDVAISERNKVVDNSDN